MIVVDTNVIAYLFIKGDHSEFAENLLKIDSEWLSTPLWRSEFRSILSLYIKKNKLTVMDVYNIVQIAEDFMTEREYQVDSDKVFHLVSSSNCSSYDCEFVSLAQSLKLTLYTSDKKIAQEFPNTAKLLKNIE